MIPQGREQPKTHVVQTGAFTVMKAVHLRVVRQGRAKGHFCCRVRVAVNSSGMQPKCDTVLYRTAELPDHDLSIVGDRIACRV